MDILGIEKIGIETIKIPTNTSDIETIVFQITGTEPKYLCVCDPRNTNDLNFVASSILRRMQRIDPDAEITVIPSDQTEEIKTLFAKVLVLTSRVTFGITSFKVSGWGDFKNGAPYVQLCGHLIGTLPGVVMPDDNVVSDDGITLLKLPTVPYLVTNTAKRVGVINCSLINQSELTEVDVDVLTHPDCLGVLVDFTYPDKALKYLAMANKYTSGIYLLCDNGGVLSIVLHTESVK